MQSSDFFEIIGIPQKSSVVTALMRQTFLQLSTSKPS